MLFEIQKIVLVAILCFISFVLGNINKKCPDCGYKPGERPSDSPEKKKP